MSKKVTLDKIDLVERDQKIGSLTSENSDLKARLAALEGKVDNQALSEDREVLGDLEPAIERRVEARVSKMMSDLTSKMDAGFSKFNERFDNLSGTVTSQNKALFSGVVANTIENYSLVSGKGAPAFEAFLQGKARGTDVSQGDFWEDAKKRNNISNLQDIVDMFLETDEGKVLLGGDDSKVESQGAEQAESNEAEAQLNIEPKGSASSSEMPAQGKYLFKASDLSEATKQYNSGQISEDDLIAFEEKFQAAFDSQQVFNDIEQ